MTAETVLKSVLAHVGIDDASAQLTSTDYEIRQILSLMNEAGKDNAGRGDWKRMIKSTTGAVSASSMALPADYDRVISTGGVFAESDGAVIKYIRDERLWKFLSARTATDNYCRDDNTNLNFKNASDASGASLNYMSKYWVTGDKEFITANSDTVLFPEYLLEKSTSYRWQRQKGLPCDDLMAEHEADIIKALEDDKGVHSD